MAYQVERVELQEQPTAVVRSVVSEEGIAEFLGGAFGEVMGVIAEQGLRVVGMPFGCYVPTADGIEVEAGFPTSAPVEPGGRVECSSLPAGLTVEVLHRGSYELVPAAYEAARDWLAEHAYEASGPPWESYLDGPEVAEPRTLVHVPCRPR
jgi:effector-binding domain-containing protein